MGRQRQQEGDAHAVAGGVRARAREAWAQRSRPAVPGVHRPASFVESGILLRKRHTIRDTKKMIIFLFFQFAQAFIMAPWAASPPA